MAIAASEFQAGLRFLTGLPRFIRRTIDPAEARTVTRRRLAQREPDFLANVERSVFSHPGSPYRRLLNLAGCELGDLRRLVAHEGLEGALATLFRAGVYLSVDEFKGRRPIVRGSSSFSIRTVDLANPTISQVLVGRSGGSRGAGTPYGMNLEFLRDRAYQRCLQLDALGAAGLRVATWGVPGGTTIGQLLQYCICGAAPERWFSQVDPATPGLQARYRWSVRLLRLGARFGGVRVPRPEHIPLDDPLPIARWMTDVLRSGGTPYLYTFASAAVRVCRAAEQAGLTLRGAWFSLGGEPITAARLAVLQRVGARGISNYSIGETGRIGQSCLAPAAPDDLHVLSDLVALIQPGADQTDAHLSPRALLVTTLSANAPLVVLNVSMGDEADLSHRQCNCPYQELGYPLHLSYVRSFEKLTAAGMTFSDISVIRVLDETLPASFGGGPTDYQLVEVEDEHGLPRLHLLAHPALGPLDETSLRETFLHAIAQGEGPERVMALQWRQGNLLTVRREPPRPTASGKILHLRQESRPDRTADPGPVLVSGRPEARR